MNAMTRVNTVYNICELVRGLSDLDLSDKVEALNAIRAALHEISPFANEPVDFVKWVPINDVQANDYNPNTVAPPEMELLRISIMADGYTQPIVSNIEDGKFVVVDGFHRNRVGRECLDVANRIQGYLPVVQIRESQIDRTERMASTIRHNRARGKHRVEAMSEIVTELKNRNWTNERIAKNLGMDEDEVLRLLQITGLSELFADQQFSKSWDVEGEITESDFEELSDDVSTYGEQVDLFRSVNTSDPDRFFHTYELWECHKAGFFATTKVGMSKEECQRAYADFLRDIPRFTAALEYVVAEWKYSCEQNLSNSAMNRIAWLGQASVCYAMGIPAQFCGGFSLLTNAEQDRANETALIYLNQWLVTHDRKELTMDEAYDGRQSDIY
jgi:ParB-like chromosome segregation protein Spo0J